MIREDYGDIWVCTDCYFAHHYGAHVEEFDSDELGLDPAGLGVDYEEGVEPVVRLWFAGEDDEPVGGWYEIRHNHSLDHNREPLGELEGKFEVADNTCSDHYYGQDDGHVECPECDDGWIIVGDGDYEGAESHEEPCPLCDGDGFLQEPCEQCGSFDDENGMDDFSHSGCEGCGSPLGGSRYRLHLWKREEVTA